MDKFFSQKNINIIKIVAVAILILIALTLVVKYVIREINESRFQVTAKFAESGPLSVDMPVYYRGYEIGVTKSVNISQDYKYTLVKIVLFPKNVKLPDDITAKVKHHNVRKEYIELVNSDTPSEVLLKNGEIINGEGAFDIEGFLSTIADENLIVPLLETFSDALSSLQNTSGEIQNFFIDTRAVLKENRENIKNTTSDLSLTSNSLTKLTSKLDKAITSDKIENTTSNIDKSSTHILSAAENIKTITQSVDKATKNLDKTVSKIDCTISEVNAVATNVKTITCALKETLRKRFAGMRIMFGKPMR